RSPSPDATTIPAQSASCIERTNSRA
ncbi:unnamed protein product, partial [Rotaria socialis]